MTPRAARARGSIAGPSTGVRIVVRCTVAERARWHAAASRLDVQLSEWVRALLDRAAPPRAPEAVPAKVAGQRRKA